MDNQVIVKKLSAPHQQEPFTRFLPLSPELVADVRRTAAAIFDELGGKALLKQSRDVYLKPNVVGTNAYVYTRPEVVEAVVRYWQAAGARNIYVIENCTQANYTRLVFEMTGYNAMCKRTGAIPVYLDEDEEVEYLFPGKPSADRDPKGYERTSFRMPATVHEKLIQEHNLNLYISLPKLKTHSMSVVTLGIKNQWGFPIHPDRSPDHNYNLHSKLVDVLSHVRPDLTLIEGVEGTIYGHYPALAHCDRSVKPFRVLIGGRNVVAVDVVGARVFGKRIADVPHLRLAIERGLGRGVNTEADITITGDVSSYNDLDLLGEWEKYGGQYPDNLIDEWPADVTRVYGAELACREGCVNNSLANLQILSFDHGGRGGWTLVMGKGFSGEVVDGIKGRVLVAGPCACQEVGPRLVERLGAGKVYFSRECNDLQAVVESMCHLMKVSPFKLAPPINPLKGGILLLQSMMNGSSGRMTKPYANFFKLR